MSFVYYRLLRTQLCPMKTMIFNRQSDHTVSSEQFCVRRKLECLECCIYGWPRYVIVKYLLLSLMCLATSGSCLCIYNLFKFAVVATVTPSACVHHRFLCLQLNSSTWYYYVLAWCCVTIDTLCVYTIEWWLVFNGEYLKLK